MSRNERMTMNDESMVCVDCGAPASRRSGLINKVYRCQECHVRMERRGMIFAGIGCGGCFGLVVLMTMLGSCGAAIALIAA